ncbi:hypothetical protein [Austwickia sp. TVS 96-490-7B]|uniref:hypothetical protein n=1 Tax=Austwickia sp. TVS 96-490-7B TaxID=2830843 RepID=UPI001C55F38D|nr:hypothetical protein [Austwickia sp. TVS 96-490-7B]
MDGYIGDLLLRAAGFDMVKAALVASALGSLPRPIREAGVPDVAFQWFLSSPEGVWRLDGLQGCEAAL